ncbi:hypothetical protein ABI59_12770 [Acidobacteria bacterium Mor1]|nr:hypothetical protein ABI59_12770 [Acidobacteria bacterium Mor1]
MKRAIPTILALLSLAGAAPCLADEVVWKADAMSCVPTSATASAGNYVTTAGRVKFARGAVGTLSFICPFDPSDLRFGGRFQLEALVRNREDFASLYPTVKAQLRAVRESDGAVLNVLLTDRQDPATIFSTFRRLYSRDALIAWSDDYTYYVQVTLQRSRIDRIGGVEQIPSLLSVALVE